MDKFQTEIIKYLQKNYVNHKGLVDMAEKLSAILKINKAICYTALKQLVADGELFEFNRNKFALTRTCGLKKGKVDIASGGFGFLRVEDADDIFIAKKNLCGAMENDTVLLKVITTDSEHKKSEGKVVKILTRANDIVVGTLNYDSGGLVVEPDNLHFNFKVYIPRKNSLDATLGEKVVAKITEFRENKNPIGKIVEIIGDINQKGNDIKCILRQFKVREDFPSDVIEYAKSTPQQVSTNALKDRQDFTNILTFTIDGEDAKDLDDAVSLQIKDGNYVLGVHIADVGHYVAQDNVLDQEAFLRATSIYFLDQVIPMLPKELSNGICSLNENEVRLTLSAIITIDKKGNIIDHNICESYIKSKHRLSYNQVTKILNGDKELCQKFSDIVETLNEMQNLSKILDANRTARGAINFELPEAYIVLDENGKAIDVKQREYNQSNKIIETFMVIANEVVARQFCEKKIPFVYRIHEKPDIEKITTFFKFLSSFGVSSNCDLSNITPLDLQQILDKVKDQDYAKVINMVMLRSLKKAKYSPKCLGHFGLASTYYCHFTSPIRRYPDLTIHRIIKHYLRNNLQTIPTALQIDFVTKSSAQSSEKEKISEDVERAVEDYKKCEYMKNYIGQTFEGVISGVLARGVFVELPSSCEGYASIDNMPKDYYVFDEDNYALVGKNNFFKLGEKVQVEVQSCNMQERKIYFILKQKVKK